MSKSKFDYKKANERKREIGNRLNELAEKLESKEQLTEQQREAINTEARELKTELEATNMRIAAALANEAAEKQGREVTMSRNAQFRELLQDIRVDIFPPVIDHDLAAALGGCCRCRLAVLFLLLHGICFVRAGNVRFRLGRMRIVRLGRIRLSIVRLRPVFPGCIFLCGNSSSISTT